MKLSVKQVYDAVDALVTIANSPRVIPAMAKFKLARMHDALEPFHALYEKKRIALVITHGTEQFRDEAKTQSAGWSVNPNSEAGNQYAEEWGQIMLEEMDVPITPITLQMLGNDPKGVELTEFKQLGELVVDTDPA